MRRIRNLYALAILFAFFSNFSNAQNAPSFRIEPASISGAAGDTVTVKVIARDYTSVLGLQFSIGLDAQTFTNITKSSTIFSTAHRVIREDLLSCFNSMPTRIIMAHLNSTSLGGTITPGEDSVLFYFKLVLVKNCTGQSVCFTSIQAMELIYHNSTGECITIEDPKWNCNTINFNFHPLKLVCNPQTIEVVNQTTVKLVATAFNGTPPYNYDWGSVKGPNSVVIPAPTKDTIIKVKVYDAVSDSAQSFININKKEIVIKDEDINITLYQGLKEFMITLNPNFGTAPYTFDWSALGLSNANYDGVKLPVPSISKVGFVNVWDSKQTLKRYRVSITILNFFITAIGSYDFFEIGDTTLSLFPAVVNGKKPLRYLWENGDTTFSSTRKMKMENEISVSLTVIDALGQIAVGSRTFYRNNTPYVKFSGNTYSFDNRKYDFRKNPKDGILQYKAEIYQQNNLVFVDSGSTSGSSFEINYNNESFFDTAFIHLTYSLLHDSYPLQDTTVIFKLKPKPVQLLQLQTQSFYFCKFDSSLILKAIVSGGVPPYYYNWGTLGEGYEVDKMPAQPTQSTTYPVTVTDQSGQKQVKEFQIHIGEVSEINKVSYSQKEVCANSEFTIRLEKSPNIEDYNGEQYALNWSLCDKNWVVLSDYDGIDDRFQLNFTTGPNSNMSNNKMIITIKSIGSREFCVDPNGKEFVDTITILPSPAFAVKYAIADTVCEGSILSIFSPPQDSTNLPNVKYEWFIYDTYDNNATYLDQPLSNYVVRSKYQFYDSNFFYYINDFIRQGARLTYTNSGCSTVRNLKHSVVIPRPKFLLKNDNQLINSNAGMLPIQVNTNLDKVQYSLSYMSHNLTGSLLDDHSFPLSGVLVNNTTNAQKLGIIVKSSLYGCQGQVDTAFVEVRNGVEDNYDFTSSDEMVTQFKSSARKVADDLGADFQYLLSPNPASSELTFSFTAQSSSSASVGIYSISGQQIMDFTFQTQKGLNAFHLSLDRLPAGSYILLFKSAENVKTERFEKL